MANPRSLGRMLSGRHRPHPIRPRLNPINRRPHLLLPEMRVNPRRHLDRRVPKQLLRMRNRHPRPRQPGSKRMPARVNVELLLHPTRCQGSLDAPQSVPNLINAARMIALVAGDHLSCHESARSSFGRGWLDSPA